MNSDQIELDAFNLKNPFFCFIEAHGRASQISKLINESEEANDGANNVSRALENRCGPRDSRKALWANTRNGDGRK